MRLPYFLLTMSLILCMAFIIPGLNHSGPDGLMMDKTKTDNFIIEPPTLVCAGFEWIINGDRNRNARVNVFYREKGSGEWLDAQPLLRIGGEKVYGHDQRWVYTAQDMFAGSIFNLQPGHVYECLFKLSDPDGVDGFAEQQVTIQTKTEPAPYKYGNVYHVYPPGFTGHKESPAFTGLNEAYYGEGNLGDWWIVPEPRVKPGDIILVHAGLYKGNRLDYVDPLALQFHGAYVLTQKGTPDRPIVIKAAGDGEVIFDGDGAYRLFDVMAADYTYFEGLTIRNTDIAFYTGLKRVLGCSGLTVKNCKIENVGIAVMNHYADSRDFYIADNIITGRHEPDTLIGWYGFEHPSPLTSYYAIKVYGKSHVICYNKISFFHDAIDVDTHGLPEGDDKQCVSIDIYGNDMFNMADDFIESDGGCHNIRIFNNRGFNSYHASISAQPVFGGPVYFIRNILYHTSGTALKFMIRPAGIFLYNNTFCSEASIDGYSNGHFRNNLFMGPDDSLPSLNGGTFTDYSTMDYDGFRHKKNSRVAYHWGVPGSKDMNNCDRSELTYTDFKNLRDFYEKSGNEQHGIELDYDIFKNVKMPDPKRKGHVYPLEGYDFSLKQSSKAIDAGCVLPDITDGYTGKAPDLGALEYGKPEPRYGPRSK